MSPRHTGTGRDLWDAAWCRLFSAKVRFMGIDVPMKIPVAMFSEEVGDVGACSWLAHAAVCR
jgi:hypothetical protein